MAAGNHPDRRPYARYLAIALAILLTPIFALATTVAVTGTVTVEVHERGHDGLDLYVPVPALLLDLAVWLAPYAVPEREMAEIRAQLAPYREGLEALARELEDCPPGVLVEVESRDERVLVKKGWRSFRVEVESPDADVTISLPARLLSRALDAVA